MVKDSNLTAQQRAGSFARRGSWQLDMQKFNHIKMLDKPDVNTMVRYTLPLELLELATAPGDTSPISALLVELKAVEGRNLYDSAFEDALQKIQDKAALLLEALPCTHANVTQVPKDELYQVLHGVETVSTEVHQLEVHEYDLQQKSQALAEQQDANSVLLAAASKVPRYAEDLLPSDALANTDGFRRGWEDEWWQSGRRQQALDVLERYKEQWARDADRDRLCLKNKELMKEQLAHVKGQLGAIQDLQNLRDAHPSLSRDVQNCYLALSKESLSRRDRALNDAHKVEKLIQDLEGRNEDAVMLFEQGVQYMNEFLPDNERRIEKVDEDLRQLDKWYHEEKRIQMYSEKTLASNPRALALQRELIELRATLKTKEEELSREVDLWSRQQEAESRKIIAAMMEEIEDKYQASWSKLSAMKELLTNERDKVMSQAPSRAKQESERQQEMKSIINQLGERKNTLVQVANACSDLTNATETFQGSYVDLHTSIACFLDERLKEAQPRSHELMLQALEIGGKMFNLTSDIECNMKECLAVADRVAAHLTILLEFTVDTHDPYAHRFNAVLEDVLAMRRRAQVALTENASTPVWIQTEMMPWFRKLTSYPIHPTAMQRFAQLQEEFPAFFAQLRTAADRNSQAVALPEVVISEPPISRYVIPVRKAQDATSPDAAATHSDTATSPFSPLPWVGAQRWAILEEQSTWSPDSPVSTTLLGQGRSRKTSGRCASAANRTSLPELPPLSPRTFDHREFIVYKPFE